MDLQQRINAFKALGQFLGQFSSEEIKKDGSIPGNDAFFERMSQHLETAVHHNGWFTRENIQFACKSWANALSETSIATWMSAYSFPKKNSPKTIAIIMAGNIPLVGFHDFLSVLITGNTALVKLSSNDNQLLPLLSEYLIAIAPGFKERIRITDKKLENFDAVIATGSDNTSRYFDYYFGTYPHIIRKNRNAVAVLTGEETPEQLNALANDVFRYFGLGCRNVSKVFLPEGYNFDPLFNGMFSWKQMINNNRYINNYDYNKAVYLMSNLDLLDNEFLLLKEDTGYSSPISVLFYETYITHSEIKQKLQSEAEQIQVIVSDSGIDKEVPFGTAQNPHLWDYADGVDTVDFLLKLT